MNMLVKDVATYDQNYAIEDRPYDIFLVAGQSNTYTSDNTIDPAIDVSGGRTWQLNQTGVFSAANEPLAHPVPLANNIGFGVAFSRDYYIPAGPAPRKDVILLPYGVSNTGFSDNRWNPGNDLFNGACGLVGVALAKYPNSTLRSILWHQGERDAAAGWTEIQYAGALDAMIAGFRVEFGDVPFICGGLRPGWVAANSATANPIKAALSNAPSRNYLVGYANPDTPTVIGASGSAVHYSATEHRLLAGRYYDAWLGL